MKNYNDYIFETATNPDFNIAYNDLIDDLNEFWITLDDSLILLSKFNARDPNKIANVKKVTKPPQQQKKVIPLKPVLNGTYEYTTNGGKIEIVQIVTPETNTNTAEVKPINPPGSNHPAEWSRLKPYQKQPTTS